MKDNELKPMLKWAGGKRYLVPRLYQLWEESGKICLIEPFVGGMAVALGLNPRIALLADINPHLVNFYTYVQGGLEITIEFENNEEYYYKSRNLFNDLIRLDCADTEIGAQLFYYLNRTCFNGLCRFNKKGEFNVPYGRYKTINYVRDFSEYQQTLGKWAIACVDFEGIAHTLKHEFIYCDPPYDTEFNHYNGGGFSWEDQERLAEWVSKQPALVAISNQATPRIIELYTRYGFEIEYIEAPRRIAANGDRTPALEVLAIKRT